MPHLVVQGRRDLPVVILFHGTGGDERQLVGLARELFPENPLLAIRGRVLENGHARYFKRFAEGVFDLESLARESKWLSQRITTLLNQNNLDGRTLVGLGYSNGATIMLHLTTYGLVKFDKLLALHAMSLEDVSHQTKKIIGTQIFLSYAENDPIVPLQNFERLLSNLTASGASVVWQDFRSGHAISQEEVTRLHDFLEKEGSL
ncbi:MAG: alpha/beta hydrolase [Streptococcaceae bacterium]|jgi:phospholipase/carboxylesterase|nr:alpha/beta hydrolase [Streptococcaceae bacterium]